jgi:3-methylcrotonyl-CoA carboxylase beta subunit
MREVLNCFLDGGELDEFQADYAKEMICGTARIGGILVGVIANSRGMSRGQKGKTAEIRRHRLHRIGGKNRVFYRKLQSSRHAAFFVQDVSGFMVGAEAEHSGIIRAGARFVEAMATATVPKLVLTD